jgi:membrane associated rhomboid family serine protease/tetratricopeptide (TPR) repeat protein
VLVLVNAGIEYLSERWDMPDLSQMCQNDNPHVWAGETWRLLASPFVHDGPIHLVAVLILLLTFGPLAEDVLGTARFVLLCVWATAVSQLASLALGSGPTCGATPVMLALVGALGASLSLRANDYNPDVRGVLGGAVLLEGVALAGMALTDLPVNMASSLGGLLAGVMLSPLLLRLPSEPFGMRGMMLGSMGVMLGCLFVIAMAPRPDEMTPYLFSTAVDRYDADDWKGAAAPLQSALELNPEGDHTRALLLYLLAFTDYQSGDASAAEAQFRASVAADPEFTEAWEKLAELATEQCEGEKALGWLREERNLLPGNPWIPLLQGDLELDGGHVDTALAAYRQALLLKGADQDVHLHMARAFLQADDLVGAKMEIVRAGHSPDATVAAADIDLSSHLRDADAPVRALLDRGERSLLAARWEADYQLGQLNESAALKAFRQGRSIEPFDNQLLFDMGEAWRDEGVSGGARALWLRLCHLTVRNQGERLLRGQAWLDLGDRAAARRDLESVHRTCTSPDATAAWARLLEADGDLRGAHQSWRAVATQRPYDGDAWFEVGRLAWHLHDNPQAAACLKRAQDLALQPRSKALATGWQALVESRPKQARTQATLLLKHLPKLAPALELASAVH